MENAPIRFLSVCSGIEAASVAWEPLGWQAAAVSEIEPFPCHVLHHRQGASRPMFMPDPESPGLKMKDRRSRAAAIRAVSTLPETGRIPNLGDMTQFKEWPDIGTIDLLVGGTPCQSFSVAGLRKGLGDPRGNLALTYLALTDRYRPKWVVWENVPGVLSSGKGRDFGAFLGGLGKLGYGFAYRVLDAQHIRTRGFPWAVPQRRRRVFVVGYLGDWRPAAAVLFDSQSLRGDPPPRRRAGERPAPTLSARTRGGGGLGTDFDVDGGLIPSHDVAQSLLAKPCSSHREDAQTYVGVPEIANPLTARMHKGVNTTMDEGQTMVAHALRGEGFDASEDGTGRGTPIVPVVDNAVQGRAGEPKGAQVNHIAFPAELSGTQCASSTNVSPSLSVKHTTAVAFAENSRAELRLCGGDGGVSSQLTTGGGKPGQGQPCIATSWAVRRLTPTECERLQGFPDGYTSISYRITKKVSALELLYIHLTHPGISMEEARRLASDGPRYKALGNSMATNAMEFLGDRIELVRGILAEQES